MKTARSNVLSPGSKKGAMAAMITAASSKTPTRAGRAPQVFIALTKIRASGKEATPILI